MTFVVVVNYLITHIKISLFSIGIVIKINNHNRSLIIRMKIGCKNNELKYESAADRSDSDYCRCNINQLYGITNKTEITECV